MSKNTFNNLCKIIDVTEDYNYKWYLDKDGDISDVRNFKVCSFPEKKSIYAGRIQYAPEMFQAIKNFILSFNSGNAKQKPLYDILCDIQDKVNER